MFALKAPKFKASAILIMALISLVWLSSSAAQNLSAQTENDLPFVELKPGNDLEADGREAQKKQLPILMFFSMKHCPFCIEVEEDYLKPMLRNAGYEDKIIIRKVRIDGTGSVHDFNGKERDASEFSAEYKVSMVPTLILVDAQGKKIAPAIIGIRNSHYYSYELDNAIDASTQKIRSLAKR
jgi:thioredoxin-related protein